MPENYFVYGEDEYLVTMAVAHIRSQFDQGQAWNVEKISSWPQFCALLASQAMFAEKQVFIADYQDMVKWPDLDHGYFQQLLTDHHNVLIVQGLAKPDKRQRLYKILSSSSTVKELVRPRGQELVDWLVNRAKEMGAAEFSRQAAEELIFFSGTNLRSLVNELAKLISYHPRITRDNVRLLATRDINVSIFDLVDATALGNVARAQGIAGELVAAGAAIPYILTMLARQYRLLFRLGFYRQQGYGSAEIEKILQVHPYVFKKLQHQAQHVDCKGCARAIGLISEADYRFKTGRGQGLALLHPLLVKLAKK